MINIGQELNNLIGENLKKIRKKNKITQSELAKLLNKKKLTISRYENGKISISFEILNELCKIFNVSIYDFLHGIEKINGLEKIDINKIENENRIYYEEQQIYINLLISLGYYIDMDDYTSNEKINVFDFSGNSFSINPFDLKDVIKRAIEFYFFQLSRKDKINFPDNEKETSANEEDSE